jgi:predicted DNA-binding transcriptional regulator AlpA
MTPPLLQLPLPTWKLVNPSLLASLAVNESLAPDHDDNKPVSIGYLMGRTGVSRTRCFQLTKRPTFPEPMNETGLGRMWRKGDVDQWLATYRPGDVQRPTT